MCELDFSVHAGLGDDKALKFFQSPNQRIREPYDVGHHYPFWEKNNEHDDNKSIIITEILKIFENGTKVVVFT
ncbi:unnamed protein product [Sphenostylis stenocarpa]|uniref:Uncharacterized protein n=1 Tax=Sphenostylis stenocarpa TaxID=92480 RepID=A0AA86RQZ5_9FABA|nr:unnamed protein product [Sphenostylis stenocarpa]